MTHFLDLYWEYFILNVGCRLEVQWERWEDNIKVGVKDVEVVTETRCSLEKVFIYFNKLLMRTVPCTG